MHSMPSMHSVRSVLEELDVQDDATQPPAAHTRRKFRRVFGLEPAADELRLGDALRVPPLGEGKRTLFGSNKRGMVS